MSASLAATPDASLVGVAFALLRHHPPSALDRNELEELLWAEIDLDLSTRCRRELAEALDDVPLWLAARGFRELLDSLWILDAESTICGGHGLLRDEIEQHVFKHSGDLDTNAIFDCLGAYTCSDKRFALFIEGLLSPGVRPNEPEQRRFVEQANTALSRFGIELREHGTDGGYPTFSLVSNRNKALARAKNLIFASATKPDLRLRDAVSNEIEVVSNADDVLIYDQPINLTEGLRWRDLQAWWAQSRNVPNDDQAKASLYRRLEVSLPSTSPPQRNFFRAYFSIFGKAIPNLPALLPEVWLHWDPKTVKERGPAALLRFRMDFLMLLPHQARIVIEVDGQHHYADEANRADPYRYARMVAADRELRLAGYDVYRFGATELLEDHKPRVRRFFTQVFAKLGLRLDQTESGPQ